MSGHRGASLLATAALMDVISRASAIQAAVVRGADEAALTAMRGEAHDALDAYLDHTTAAAVHVRAIIED